MVGLDLGVRDGRGEDPQRVREMERLHQAMMTVDSIANDGWETWMWESVGDIPRGPRSLGWAVANSELREEGREEGRPPPYVVSQYEIGLREGRNEYGGGVYHRPRSSG